MHTQDADEESFVVLFVCTGNICRSPVGEQLLRARTTGITDLLTIQSAGTHARHGEPMTEQAAALSRLYGGDPSRHGASAITVPKLRRADLVLTMTRDHRAEVVSEVPRASRKTFTLREFTRLVATHAAVEPEAAVANRSRSPAGLVDYVSDVARMRGYSSSFPTAEDDNVVDPFRREQDVYDQAGALISAAVAVLAQTFLNVTSSGSRQLRDEVSQNGILDLGQRRSAQQQWGEP